MPNICNCKIYTTEISIEIQLDYLAELSKFCTNTDPKIQKMNTKIVNMIHILKKNKILIKF
jgi:hypothetical protein